MVVLDCDSDMDDMYNSKEDSDSVVDNCDDGVGDGGRCGGISTVGSSMTVGSSIGGRF
jgi:hypothetical protein